MNEAYYKHLILKFPYHKYNLLRTKVFSYNIDFYEASSKAITQKTNWIEEPRKPKTTKENKYNRLQ